jgi:uncharacterized protein
LAEQPEVHQRQPLGRAAVVGLDRVIWSADYPFLHLDSTRELLAGLDLTPEDREKITHRNAARLFRLDGA